MQFIFIQLTFYERNWFKAVTNFHARVKTNQTENKFVSESVRIQFWHQKLLCGEDFEYFIEQKPRLVERLYKIWFSLINCWFLAEIVSARTNHSQTYPSSIKQWFLPNNSLQSIANVSLSLSIVHQISANNRSNYQQPSVTALSLIQSCRFVLFSFEFLNSFCSFRNDRGQDRFQQVFDKFSLWKWKYDDFSRQIAQIMQLVDGSFVKRSRRSSQIGFARSKATGMGVWMIGCYETWCERSEVDLAVASATCHVEVEFRITSDIFMTQKPTHTCLAAWLHFNEHDFSFLNDDYLAGYLVPMNPKRHSQRAETLVAGCSRCLVSMTLTMISPYWTRAMVSFFIKLARISSSATPTSEQNKGRKSVSQADSITCCLIVVHKTILPSS